jgi:hypothetical protein
MGYKEGERSTQPNSQSSANLLLSNSSSPTPLSKPMRPHSTTGRRPVFHKGFPENTAAGPPSNAYGKQHHTMTLGTSSTANIPGSATP